MKPHTDQVIDRVRKHHSLKAGDVFGVVSGIAKDTRIAQTEHGEDIVSMINTAAIDLSEEVVLPQGCIDKHYIEINGKVFADHLYDIEHTVGWLRNELAMYPSKGEPIGWRARTGILQDNPHAKAVRAIIEETGSIGTSIGFVPINRSAPTEEELKRYGKNGRKFDSIVREWSLFEFSYTCLPCNVECQTLRTAADDSKIADYERLVTTGKIGRESAAALGIPGVTPKRTMFHVERTLHANGVVLTRKVEVA